MLLRQQLSGWRPCFSPTTERNMIKRLKGGRDFTSEVRVGSQRILNAPLVRHYINLFARQIYLIYTVYSLCKSMHRTVMSVPIRFNTNTCIVTPLIYIYIYINIYIYIYIYILYIYIYMIGLC